MKIYWTFQNAAVGRKKLIAEILALLEVYVCSSDARVLFGNEVSHITKSGEQPTL
jgi:hypothetical protein